MQDVHDCPICGTRLKIISKKKLKYLHIIGKQGFYTEKVCVQHHTHYLQIFSNVTTNKIDFIKFSINTEFSRIVEVDFHNKKSRIQCLNQGISDYIIHVPNVLELDFPTLTKLKEKVSMYIVIS